MTRRNRPPRNVLFASERWRGDGLPSRRRACAAGAAGGALLFLILSRSNLRVADRLLLAGTDAALIVVVSEVLREHR